MTAKHGRPAALWIAALGLILALTLPAAPALADESGSLPALETEEHIRYINGMGEGLFVPDGSLTRAEAATMIYNLLTDTTPGDYDSAFTDVSAGAWYYDAVSTLASYQILRGYEDGSFRPNGAITRAEFVTVLVRLTGAEAGDAAFSDVSGDYWAADAISAASAQGWVEGYGDGSFRPGSYITRAEAVTIVNRVLGRTPDEHTIALGEGILQYLDVTERHWAYWNILEASIGHTYTTGADGESWTDYTVESLGLPGGVNELKSGTVYIDENGQLTLLQAGVNRVGDTYYYAAEAGYLIDRIIDPSALAQGFQTIEGVMVYVDGGSLLYWEAGVTSLDGTLYYTPAAGYACGEAMANGITELDGALYLSGDEAVHVSGSLWEYDGALYSVNSDDTLLQNGWVGLLYFGADGKYTSGNASVDAYVDGVLGDIAGDGGMSQLDKLYWVYEYLRGDTDRAGAFSASSPKAGETAGIYDQQGSLTWLEQDVIGMTGSGGGNSSAWAGVYIYLARRLGFQAYPVVGTLTQQTNGGTAETAYCWAMIQWDSQWHISDVFNEYCYLNQKYKSYPVVLDLFDQTVTQTDLAGYTYTNSANTSVGDIGYSFPAG
ncbi:MAG: S-layer homology domain-containing protein [Oscillospiraceae bacterium]|nr:S-layer homology domain-containing protein [Oscillospiraceae bacterium]